MPASILQHREQAGVNRLAAGEPFSDEYSDQLEKNMGEFASPSKRHLATEE
jgi:hypothetical protein